MEMQRRRKNKSAATIRNATQRAGRYRRARRGLDVGKLARHAIDADRASRVALRAAGSAERNEGQITRI